MTAGATTERHYSRCCNTIHNILIDDDEDDFRTTAVTSTATNDGDAAVSTLPVRRDL